MSVKQEQSKAQESTTKILQAASQLFLEGGVGSLSVRAIANRAGMSTIGIYSHFQGKQGILDALYIEGFELVSAAMQTAYSGRATRQDVLNCVKEYLRIGRDHEAHYRLIFGESDRGYQPSKAAVAASQTAFDKLVEVAGSYLTEPVSERQRQRFALDVWAISHGYVSLSHHAIAGQGWDLDAMALCAVELHLDALN